jgi:hypothetical protein
MVERGHPEMPLSWIEANTKKRLYERFGSSFG